MLIKMNLSDEFFLATQCRHHILGTKLKEIIRYFECIVFCFPADTK